MNRINTLRKIRRVRQLIMRNVRSLLYIIPMLFFLYLLNEYKGAPAEDAHILFRYAENLVTGHGYGWNADVRGADGVTEKLWLAMLLPSYVFHVEIGIWAKWLSGLFGLLTIYFIFYFTRRLGGTVWTGLALAMIYAGSMTVVQAASGMGTILFSLLLLLSGCLLLIENRWTALLFALTFMARPEGLIYALLCYLAYYVWIDGRGRKWLLVSLRNFGIISFAWVLLCILVTGSPMTNTLWAKQGRELFHPSGLTNTYIFLLYVCAFHFLLTWVVVTRKTWLFAVPLIFPFFYLGIERMQNIGFRFQFFILPVLLVFSNAGIARLDGIVPRMGTTLLLYMTVFAVVYGFTLREGREEYFDDRRTVGEQIKTVKGTLLTTEAGCLPYFAGKNWTCYDPVGLLDEHIAHEGLDSAYMEKISPDLIMFHAYSSEPTTAWSPDPKWNKMLNTIWDYCCRHRYMVAAVLNVPYDCRWYVVKPSYFAANLIFTATAYTDGEWCYNSRRGWNPKYYQHK